MKKFVFIFNGPQATEAPSDEVMQAWGKWFESLGENLVDPGNPFGTEVKEVTTNSVSEVTEGRAMGYSIVNAADFEAASEMATGCPMLGAEHCSVYVYEALPM